MHTDSPESLVAVEAEAQPSTGLRRRLIGAGLIGLAGSLLPRLTTNAGATSDTPATTTTAAPRQPQAEDVEILGATQSAELAAIELYRMALAAGSLSESTTAVVNFVMQSHVSYGQGLNGLMGRTAPGTVATEIVEQFTADFSGDEASIIAAAFVLEDTLVATHTQTLGQLSGTDGAAQMAAMIIAEAQHSLVFADLSGQTDVDTIFTSAQALELGEG